MGDPVDESADNLSGSSSDRRKLRRAIKRAVDNLQKKITAKTLPPTEDHPREEELVRERFLKPFSFEFIIAAVIALLNFALDQADIHNMLITWLSIAICPLLIIDGMRRTEWAARIGRGSIRFVGSCCLIAAAFIALAVWVNWRHSYEGYGSSPFFIEAESSWESPSTDRPTPIWVTFWSNGKMVRAPLSAMLEVSITNHQSEAVMINTLSIEKEVLGGGWIKVARIPGAIVRVYWGVTDSDLKNAMEFRPQMLDQLMQNRALGPKETVQGWLLLCFPNPSPAVVLSNKYRITIADMEGHRSVRVVAVGKSGNFSDLGFDALPSHSDISAYPMVFIQTMKGFW